MHTSVQFLTAAITSLLLAGPALAADSSAVPEPSTVTLLALGVAGVIIGRRFARKRPEE